MTITSESGTAHGVLDGRVVLVTGGNGGIGLGMAKGCAAAGADLVIWGTNNDKLGTASEVLGALTDRVVVQRVDVSDEEQVNEAFAEAVAQMGKVDSVFANAGVGAGSPFVDETLENWRRVQSINLDGTFLTFRAAARHMIERGGGGALVGIASVAAVLGAPRGQAYAVSKSGIVGLCRGLSVELGPHGIRCNSLLPGFTETELTTELRNIPGFLERTTARTPIGRWGTTDDYTSIAVFLADPTQRYQTGSSIVLDGGYSIA